MKPLLLGMLLVAALLPGSTRAGGDEATVESWSAAFSEIGRLRRVAPDGADSDCIGDPRTPLCAVDTWYGCAARLDLPLCRRIGVELWEIPVGQGPEGHDEWVQTKRYYVVTGQAVVMGDSLRTDPSGARYVGQYVKPGDLQLFVIDSSCIEGRFAEQCTSPQSVDFILRKSGDEWHVIAYGLDSPEFGHSYEFFASPQVD